MKKIVKNDHDGWECIEHDVPEEVKYSYMSHCCECGNPLELGKKYATWSFGGIWCDVCGPKAVKEALDKTQEVYDAMTKA
jgi:hypothetical protein